ncbi:MAG TPA: SRPBCC family protein [Catenuloplanes sp.]
MADEVQERISVAVPPDEVYAAVSDVRRMAVWSSECFAVWVWRRRGHQPERFIGWNRRAGYLWFTTCRVVTAEPGREFAFDVSTFGQPVSRWGYRLAPTAGGTLITEYWQDRRNRMSVTLGRVFTGRVAKRRPQANRDGMRQTLGRIKRELERRSG